jgi:hypothetical protein
VASFARAQARSVRRGGAAAQYQRPRRCVLVRRARVCFEVEGGLRVGRRSNWRGVGGRAGGRGVEFLRGGRGRRRLFRLEQVGQLSVARARCFCVGTGWFVRSERMCMGSLSLSLSLSLVRGCVVVEERERETGRARFCCFPQARLPTPRTRKNRASPRGPSSSPTPAPTPAVFRPSKVDDVTTRNKHANRVVE